MRWILGPDNLGCFIYGISQPSREARTLRALNNRPDVSDTGRLGLAGSLAITVLRACAVLSRGRKTSPQVQYPATSANRFRCLENNLFPKDISDLASVEKDKALAGLP